jgi:hypothetical protein
MRAIQVNLYAFDELGDDAKEAARDFFRLCPDHWDSSDWWASAQAFAELAPISIDEADYDRRDVRVRWMGDEDVAELSGLRAWKWLNNNGPHVLVGNGSPSWLEAAEKEAEGNCGLTGFCGDAPLFDPIAEIRDPRAVPTLRELFEDCADRWMREAADDMEYTYSDECIDEMIRADAYEFYEDGTPAQ